MRLVVIGAGPAGTRAAIRAAESLPEAQVTLIGAEAGLPYDRVALSRLLAGEIEEPALITHDAQALRAARIDYRPATRITRIDRAARMLHAADGAAIPYGHLVLALGGEALRLPIPGADLPGVIGYRELPDVQRMLRLAQRRGQAVVIGGGLLGLEAAAGLAGRGMEVSVVHAVGWPMERQLDPCAGALLARRMGARGIRFVMPARSVALEGQGHVQGVRLEDGRLLPARLVVMAVGIRPNTALAREAGLDVGRGIRTDAQLFTNDAHIQAVGECAEVQGVCVGLAAPALEQAQAAIAALRAVARRAPREDAHWAPRTDAAALKVSGTDVWSAGDIAAEAQALTLHNEAADEYRRLLVRDDRLVGAVLYGDTRDAGFYLELIKRGAPLGRLRAELALGPQFLDRAA